MRNGYIVSYDVTDPKVWRRVYKTLIDAGDHIQYSVFRCELSPIEKVQLIEKLSTIIHHKDDQLLFIDIGPAPGRSDRCVEALGRAYTIRSREAVIV